MFRKIACSLLIVGATAATSAAQISVLPQQPPAVTAESRAWFLSGVPIAYGGGVYYPSGPDTHFSRNEMVETGMFEGVPIYVRTTMEPGSVIFVPLAGAVMRPYERRRSGDLAGTTGSSAPGFVVEPPQPSGQLAANPAFVYAPVDWLSSDSVGTAGYTEGGNAPSAPPAPPALTLGTSAGERTVALAQSRPVPTRLQTVQRPVGLNSIYLNFQDARWFAAGPAIELPAERFTRVGDYRGFAVYAEAGHPEVIYVALVADAPGLVSPYKTR
jgi:hypothetical protein